MLTDRSKTYQAVMPLGCKIDTQDTTGTILAENRGGALSPTGEQVRDAIMGFRGGYAQIPPIYFALKVDGKKLYELARTGKEMERQLRSVQILDMKVNGIDLSRVWTKVTCSKGTCVCTLYHDIGRFLGCGDYMEYLTRTGVDRFSAEDSLTPGQLEQLRGQGELEGYILPMEEALQPLRPLRCLPEADSLSHNGNSCLVKQLDQSRSGKREAGAEDGQIFHTYDSNHRFTGVYQYQKDRHWRKPWKMFSMQHSMQCRRNIWNKGKTRK